MKRTAFLFFAMLAAIAAVAAPAAADGPPAAGRFRGVMLRGNPDAMTEDDFATLGRWGANLVRFQMPVGWRKPHHWESNDDYDAYIGHCLDVLQEKVLAWADAHGQKVVLDLHATPGSRTEDMESRVFLEQRYADHFVETWRRIAERFKGDRRLYCYDLINEPTNFLPSPAGLDYWSLQVAAAKAIREEDPDACIVFESNLWSQAPTYAMMKPVPMSNVVYQVHMYAPKAYTHQGTGADGGAAAGTLKWPDPEKGYGRDWLRGILQPVREFCEKNPGTCIYVGEFSASVWAPGAENYLRDCIALFDEYGWDWTYHAYRESKSWNVEMTVEDGRIVPAKEDTPRKRVLVEGLRGRAGAR